jgi:hypothetical protein
MNHPNGVKSTDFIRSLITHQSSAQPNRLNQTELMSTEFSGIVAGGEIKVLTMIV